MNDAAALMARVEAREPEAFGELDRAYRRLMCQHIARYANSMALEFDDDDVDAVAADWLIFLWDHAAAWDPHAGASPINWSRRGVNRLVWRHVTGHSVRHGKLEFDLADIAETMPAEPDQGESSLEMLRRMATTDQRVALALELLEEAVPEFNLDQLLEAMICPRGAALLARKNLAAVRRQRARHQLVLRERIATDERFAPLAGAFAAR